VAIVQTWIADVEADLAGGEPSKEETPTRPLEPVGGAGRCTSAQAEESPGEPLLEQVLEQTPPKPRQKWMNVTEAADYVGVTPPTIRRWIVGGQLEFSRQEGNRYLFSERQLNDCKERTEARKARAEERDKKKR